MSMSLVACLTALVQLQSCDAAAHQSVARDTKASAISPVSNNRYFARPNQWHGAYGGGSIGYGSGESTQSYDRNNNHGLATVDPDGFTFSATAGYNYMVTSHFLTGIEADLGIMSLSSGTHTVYDGHQWNGKFGPFWGTLRGRFGYASGDWLFFGSAGLAFMQTDNVSVGNTAPETAVDDKFRAGWVIGAGVEKTFSDRITGKLEYLHMDFGKYSSYSANNEPYWFKDNVDMIRLGVNYRF